MTQHLPEYDRIFPTVHAWTLGVFACRGLDAGPQRSQRTSSAATMANSRRPCSNQRSATAEDASLHLATKFPTVVQDPHRCTRIGPSGLQQHCQRPYIQQMRRIAIFSWTGDYTMQALLASMEGAVLSGKSSDGPRRIKRQHRRTRLR